MADTSNRGDAGSAASRRAAHFDETRGPKRILSLDGGGVRGRLTLQYLRAIEKILRARYANQDYRLCDYFDLIGGTSTGAIIAASLALGKTVDEIDRRYSELATSIFRKRWYQLGAFLPKFGRADLVRVLQANFGADTRVGSDLLETGLLVVAKRMDSGSSWVLTNHPRDRYYLPKPGEKRVGNCNMLLWQVVRASTAAPSYFKPEPLVVGSWTDPSSGQLRSDDGEFVDGGVTPANNPSLQCLRAALIKGYGFWWTAGPTDLLLVSIGTGLRRRGAGKAVGWRKLSGVYAFNALLALMDDCTTDVELTMQWLAGGGPTLRKIDSVVGNLKDEWLVRAPLLSYRRYNLRYAPRPRPDRPSGLEECLPDDLSQDLRERLVKEFDQYSAHDLDLLSRMDRPASLEELQKLGELAAGAVLPEHFPAAFDPTS